jgi:hypothetical protein
MTISTRNLAIDGAALLYLAATNQKLDAGVGLLAGKAE